MGASRAWRYRSRTDLTTLLLLLSLTVLPIGAQTTPSSSTGAAPSATPSLSVSGFPSSLTLPPLNSTSPVLQLSLPSTTTFYLTFSICVLSANSSLLPTILVSTASPPSFVLGARTSSDPSSGGVSKSTHGFNRKSRAGTTWLVEWDKGFGNWTYDGDVTGVGVLIGLGLGTDGTLNSDLLQSVQGNAVIQIGVSGTEALYYLSTDHLFLGDTTATAALLFSPILLLNPHEQPSYPNYTLPPATLTLPQAPLLVPTQTNLSNLSPELTLIIVPTTSSPTQDGLDFSLCAAAGANASTGSVAAAGNMLLNATTQWASLDGEEGFRTMWVVGGLLAETNYTAWAVDGQGGISKPMWFATKEASFPCQLLLPTSLCPSIGYAAPLSANTTTTGGLATPYPLSSLPDDLSSLLTTSLQSFSTSLLSEACGRDLYSHVSSCADCYASYRDWLCRVLIPQCASTSANAAADPQPSTVARTPANPRNPAAVSPYDYTELLPCMSVCNAVDRSCPLSLGFRCPLRGKVANMSYAFSGQDDDKGDGSGGTGLAAQDIWGNRWCNG